VADAAGGIDEARHCLDPIRLKEQLMNIENVIRLFAGTVILASLSLGAQASPVFHSDNWLWLTAFVGANLLQSSLTGLCPLQTVLRKLGLKSGGAACGI
jgi:hypothetical protein